MQVTGNDREKDLICDAGADHVFLCGLSENEIRY